MPMIYAVTEEMAPEGFGVWTEGWEEVRSVWSTRALAEVACVQLLKSERGLASVLHIRAWSLDDRVGIEGILHYEGT
jgi:hypothetical protein